MAKIPASGGREVANEMNRPGKPGQEGLRLIFFGTYDASTCPRVEILKEGFSAFGDQVLECNVPLRLDTAQRLRILNHPLYLPILAWRLLQAWFRLRFRARLLPHVDAVIVGYMGHFDVHLARHIWRKTPVILDHLISAKDTARDRRADSGWLHQILNYLDIAAIRAADVCCVDTEEQVELVPEKLQHKAVVVSVGASNTWFHPPKASSSGRLKVIFFGSYTPLQGAPLIGQAIADLASVQAPIDFTMVGTGQDHASTRHAARHSRNTTWIDWVMPPELPSLVSDHDVCLGIFGTGSKALRVVPNKVFQGSAAGCAIITSDTEPQRRALDDAAVFVEPTAKSLALALLDLAADPSRVEALKQAAYSRAQEAFRPQQTVQPLRKLLEELSCPV